MLTDPIFVDTGDMSMDQIETRTRKLRLGQPVHTTDGPFGELADIVVDPTELTVTHIVVEPRKQHHQARLVPIWLTSVDEGVLTVQLTSRYLRQLQRVNFTDFVKVGETLDLGPDWDVGTEEVVSLPYVDMALDRGAAEDRVKVVYDRIPKHECEIRRLSEVITSDDHSVGHVQGFVASGDQLTAVIVRTGLPGFRRNKALPMSSVARVLNDRIELVVTADNFQSLPAVEDPDSWGHTGWNLEILHKKLRKLGSSLSRQSHTSNKD